MNLTSLISIYNTVQVANVSEQRVQLSDNSGGQNNQVTSPNLSEEVEHLVYVM